MKKAPPMQDTVGMVTSLRGLMVEVQITGSRPDSKELLSVEGHPEVFLEVSLFIALKNMCSCNGPEGIPLLFLSQGSSWINIPFRRAHHRMLLSALSR